MYTVKELYELTEKPNITVISLKLLQDYYETYLKPFKYTYHLGNGQIVELIFEEHRLCHLLGLETIAIGRFGKQNTRRTKPYRGMVGYQKIKDGTHTFSTLKGLSKKMYNSVKDKFIFFYLIPHIIESPEIVIDYIHDSSTRVQCKIMIFDRLHGVQVHLGIEIQSDGSYFPRTFLIERLTEFTDGTRFTANQPNKIGVKKIEVSEVATGKILRTHILTVMNPKKAKN